MTDTNYPIAAMGLLLDRDCLPVRYHPLVQYRESLPQKLAQLGCEKKHDAELLPDEALLQAGLDDEAQLRLFRRFLTLYDPDPRKFREIEQSDLSPEEKAAYQELFCLPGVKRVRASLYLLCGYASLRAFAQADAAAVIRAAEQAIREKGLPYAVPLPKEVRTQIAVARAFLWK